MKQGIVSSPVQHSVLIISSMADAAGFAASLGSTLECAVSVAPTYRSGLMALRHQEYSVVVVDDCLAESNPAAADLLWQSFGMAVPVQINFAIAGASRLTREVQAAIAPPGTAAGRGPARRRLPAGKRIEIHRHRAAAAVAIGARRTGADR